MNKYKAAVVVAATSGSSAASCGVWRRRDGGTGGGQTRLKKSERCRAAVGLGGCVSVSQVLKAAPLIWT